jgi:hypothetical protein
MKLKVIMVIHNCNRCDENKDDPCLAKPAAARPLIFYYWLLFEFLAFTDLTSEKKSEYSWCRP